MGRYVIHIEAVGGHGCQRDRKNGETLEPFCGDTNCPDCKTRAFVAELLRSQNVTRADLIHWPNADGSFQTSTVIDNLLTDRRAGCFGLADGESNIGIVGHGPAFDWKHHGTAAPAGDPPADAERAAG